MESTAPRLNQDNKTHLARQIIIYSALFAVIAFSIYHVFILQGKTFFEIHESGAKDGFAQRYMYAVEFKRFLINLFSNGQINTWDWSIGLGADGYSYNVGSLFNPLSYLVILFPLKYMDIGYSISIILRIYLAGFMFLLFARKVRLDDLQSIVGAIAYSFCPWIIVISVTQGQFITGAVLLPLVLLGAEKVLQGESPAFFMLIVAYALLLSLQSSYAIGIITVPYFIIRYFTDYNEGTFKAFCQKLGLFIVYGIVGIITSAIGFAMTVFRYGGAEFDSNTSATPLLFAFKEYVRLPSKLMAWGSFFGNYSFIGVAAICLVMIPVIVYCLYKKRTSAIMTVLVLIMIAIPYFSSMFNFFSYLSGRWFFVLSFFFAWAAAEALDAKYLKNKYMKFAILGTFGLYCLYIFWFRKNMEDMSIEVAKINLIAAAVMIVIILIRYSDFATIRPVLAKSLSIAGVAALALSLMAAYYVKMADYPDGNLKFGESYELMQTTPQRAAQYIDDSDFYRVDQTDGIDRSRAMMSKVNEAMAFGNRSVYEFSSSVDAGWLEFHKLLGNNAGYFKRTSPNSNDNRMGIDLLTGVKYYLGNDQKGREDASQYAGYGFEDYKTLDGVDVLKNRYSIGLGTVYDKCITEKEFESLNYAQRELVLLQAAVMTDDYDGSCSKVSVESLDTDVDEIGCTVEGNNKITLDTDAKSIKVYPLPTGERTVEVNGTTTDTYPVFGEMTIKTDVIKNSQVLLCLKNFNATCDGSDVSFILNIVCGEKEKMIAVPDESSQGLSGLDDVTVNLGYIKDGNADITVQFLSSGDFTYDGITAYATPVTSYENYAEKLEKTRFRTSELKGDTVKGTVTAETNGILYLSIPDNNGWDIYVDGSKAEKIDESNIAFTGIEVSAGQHDIKMIYHTKGLGVGLILTLMGLFVIILTVVKKKPKTLQKQNR